MCFSSGLNWIESTDLFTKENGTSSEVPSSNMIKYVSVVTAEIFPNVPSSSFTLDPTLNFLPVVIRNSSDSLRPFF